MLFVWFQPPLGSAGRPLRLSLALIFAPGGKERLLRLPSRGLGVGGGTHHAPAWVLSLTGRGHRGQGNAAWVQSGPRTRWEAQPALHQLSEGLPPWDGAGRGMVLVLPS